MTVLIGIGFSFLGLVANVISTAIPYWQYYKYKHEGNSFVTYQGLWKACDGEFGASVCVNLDSGSQDWCQAVRGLMIIGAICLAIGISISFYGLRSKQTVKSAGFVAFGGVCCVVAVIIYGAKAPHGGGEHLHAGFGLAIAAGVVSFVGGCFLVEVNVRNKSYNSI